MRQKLERRKGFTLAELLIVIAIIAILVAIAIPVFSVQLNKAKAGADLANLRSAISVASIQLMTNSNATPDELKQACETALGTDGITAQYGTGTLEIKLNTAGDAVDAKTCTLGGKTVEDLKKVAGTGAAAAGGTADNVEGDMP